MKDINFVKCTARDHPTPPLKIILLPNIFNKNQHIYLQSMFRLSFQSNAYRFNMKYTGLGVGGGPDPKKKGFNRLLIHISNIDG